MGNVFSTGSTRAGSSVYVTSESETMNDTNTSPEVENMDQTDEGSSSSKEERAKVKEDEMTEFKKQLNIKREQRREILFRHKSEKMELEKMLHNERKSKLELVETNRLLRELLRTNDITIPENLQSATENTELMEAITRITEDFEELKRNNNSLRKDLAESNSSLQNAYSDIADLNMQNTESMKQIRALKEVVAVSKTMINLRENQLSELKDKLNEIEVSLADRETSLLSADLRQEYARQLQNIRTLRGLYEERARLAEVTRQGLVRDLAEQKLLCQAEVAKSKELTAKIQELEEKVEGLQDLVENKNNQISTARNETNGLKSEMDVVNKLFSQVLLGYKTKQDLDQLVHRLEENHGLLTHMAERENGSEASSALPKLLLELVSQVEDIEQNKEKANESNECDSPEDNEKETEVLGDIPGSSSTTAEEIVENLPKVWRVLMELLSHQSVVDENSPEKVTTCYKSVETKSGPVLVPSVSQTYIRLKDLILEKLGLIKEVNRMKQLNTHLETRLGEQERRLCLVTTELSKTWHVVGRLRRHHHQLHTHEKILKYELQQKRKLLNELKEELQYCREKWEQAREKNTQSEKDWKKLRAEFTSRKIKSDSPSFNHSGESGYSDERPSDESSESNDESEYVAEKLHRNKKKLKKSFETILDSSTDFNLAAEREDPASDMLDVADLPLDTHDCGDNQPVISEPCTSEQITKSEHCTETEDEVGDIVYDDSNHIEGMVLQGQGTSFDTGPPNTTSESNKSMSPDSDTVSPNTSHISPAEILRNVQLQNERLAKKDKKLEQLEKNTAALLKQTQSTAKFSDQINNDLDTLLGRPTSSHTQNSDSESETQASSDSIKLGIVNGDLQSQIDHSKQKIDTGGNAENLNNEPDTKITEQNNLHIEDGHDGIIAKTTTSLNLTEDPVADFQANVGEQDERLQTENKVLEKSDNRCSDTDQNISSTLETDDKIIENVVNVHNEHENEDNPCSDLDGVEPEASTSNELNHEARFAARDIRLKRLEEQTKSLVNKVNKTTSKGVKINYKLDELHNIYGSENSRAGTPCDDAEEENDEDKSSEQ